ncbi:MAG: hypothetical protein QXX08_06980 [Candidatus Bathyarchaeia archaeon]
MFIKRISLHCSDSKAAVSTVLGMLIFIGILFTCVIPLFLYVNQVNSYYDQAVLEMKHLDDNKQRETIDVYAYPLDTSKETKSIYVYVKNQCPLSVEILRIWVNDLCYNYSLEVPAMGWNVTEAIDISGMLPTEGNITINIKVTTTRGNIISSLINPLFYSSIAGWSSSGTLSINIVINRDHSGTETFNVKVYKVVGLTETIICDEDIRMIGNTISYVKKVDLSDIGSYHVMVKYKGGSAYLYNNYIQINLANPCYWVYVSV